ncbi:MAG: YHS domain-containing protein [Desulfobulbaceae bacterium]|jgi:YHS domain-containing protein|nr:YHS domain-containing protein [Desulfobulbaceae bacterium]
MIPVTIFWILVAGLVAGLVVYLMMKRGSGCCGGHGDHQEHPSEGGSHDNASDEHQHDEHAKHTDQGADKDPVCGMGVSDGAASSDFAGKTYRFCSDSCKESFDKDPGKYVGG